MPRFYCLSASPDIWKRGLIEKTSGELVVKPVSRQLQVAQTQVSICWTVCAKAPIFKGSFIPLSQFLAALRVDK
jgi:hypothetical protein